MEFLLSKQIEQIEEKTYSMIIDSNDDEWSVCKKRLKNWVKKIELKNWVKKLS